MKIAYVDCFSGISGDMLLGALLDAGVSLDELKDALSALKLEGFSVRTSRESKNGLFGTRVLIGVEAQEQGHRNFRHIRKIIQEAGLSPWVKQKSIEVFELIAKEEGKIHNRPFEEVEFHEVGATDSILDIVGSVLAIEKMGIEALYASSLPLGSGFVNTAHGTIPVPAPATIALLKGVPVYDSGIQQELVTPTGAALLRGLVRSFGSMPPMVIEKVGYGVGTYDLPDRPNLLRILVGEDREDARSETVLVLEANLDDTNPEWLGYLMDRLFKAGALDVVFLPAHMKKNRPGTLLQVIARPDQRDVLSSILFRESTTLGVRFRYSLRQVLRRSLAEIESPWGKIEVKKVFMPGGTFYFQPEYEACRKIAEREGKPIREIYYWVISRNEIRPK